MIPPLFVLKSFWLLFAVSSFDLGDKQKRWVVIGICLNRLLLPVLRDFTRQEISKHYTSLKSSNKIDTQVFGSPHLIHDGSFKLNYSSINNNWGRFKRKERLYDYKVTTDVDLAKLYLEPHMAKFTGETICCVGESPTVSHIKRTGLLVWNFVIMGCANKFEILWLFLDEGYIR